MLSLQQLVGAAERLRATRAERLDDEDLLAEIERARARLASTPFVSDPLHGFVSNDGGKERLFASPSLGDCLIEEAARPLLELALEPALSTAVHSWRAAFRSGARSRRSSPTPTCSRSTPRWRGSRSRTCDMATTFCSRPPTRTCSCRPRSSFAPRSTRSASRCAQRRPGASA